MIEIPSEVRDVRSCDLHFGVHSLGTPCCSISRARRAGDFLNVGGPYYKLVYIGVLLFTETGTCILFVETSVSDFGWNLA